jgi:mRNA interferase MazF
MKGKIVLVPFPFTDLTAAKLRPALVVYEGEKDAVVAFISSKIPSELSDVDILIRDDHPGFKKAGLKVDSVIKLDKIATILKDLIVGELGELDEDLKKEVNDKLKRIMEI